MSPDTSALIDQIQHESERLIVALQSDPRTRIDAVVLEAAAQAAIDRLVDSETRAPLMRRV